MPILETGDIGINHLLEGDADLPTLVFSNSLGTDLTMWDSQVGALSPHFRILHYDTRGHGASSVADGPYTIDISVAYFCGVSMGGMIGQWMGIHAPERLGKLILSNTAASIGTAERWNDRIQHVQQGGMESVRVYYRKYQPVEELPDSLPVLKATTYDDVESEIAGCIVPFIQKLSPDYRQTRHFPIWRKMTDPARPKNDKRHVSRMLSL